MKTINFISAVLFCSAFVVVIFMLMGEMGTEYGLPADAQIAGQYGNASRLLNTSQSIAMQSGVLEEEGKVGESTDQDTIVRKGFAAMRNIPDYFKVMGDFLVSTNEILGLPVWVPVILTILGVVGIMILLSIILRGGGMNT